MSSCEGSSDCSSRNNARRGQNGCPSTADGVGTGHPDDGVFFKQKTAYEIMSGDWSSDVCSSD
eukprot:COSAG06_NODE_60450_length_271_cov_0.302326_1_plen_62_part_01